MKHRNEKSKNNQWHKVGKKEKKTKRDTESLRKKWGGGVQSQGELEIKSGNTSLISASEKQW